MSMILATIGTFSIYFLAKKIYKRWSYPFFNPLLLSTAFIIGSLYLLNIPANAYIDQAKGVTHLLGPATVAFAIPIYKYMPLLKKYFGNDFS